MRRLVLATVALGAITAASIAPAEAHWRGHGGWGGPGIGFGLAAGALAFGAAAASPYGPGYYGGPYGYYGPRRVYYAQPYYQPYYGRPYRPYGYW